MKLMNRFYSLLALLLVGSASLQAQDTDPFPDFNFRLYSSNVVLTAQVKQNNEVVTDALVAVFCGNEIRGKKRVGEGTDPNVLYMMVYGDYQAEYQYLHFKVYTGGKIFTYNPNPAIDWEDYYNKALGSTSNPYIIDITPVSLANNADNMSTLTTYKDKTCDVVLTGRTLYKDGNWNTLCLPFTLTASEVNEHLKNPIGLMTLSSSSFDSTKGTLTLNFSNEMENGIVAGKPYIVKWNKPDGYTVDGGFDITDPVFTSVTISDATANVSTDYVDFIGTYSPKAIYEDGTEKHNLYLSDANTLYYPTAEGYKVNSCRAWFQLKNGLTCGTPAAHVSAFYLNFDGEETSIHNSQCTIHNEAGAWYTIDGRQIVYRKSSNRKMQKGLYINNGKKVVIN